MKDWLKKHDLGVALTLLTMVVASIGCVMKFSYTAGAIATEIQTDIKAMQKGQEDQKSAIEQVRVEAFEDRKEIKDSVKRLEQRVWDIGKTGKEEMAFRERK